MRRWERLVLVAVLLVAGVVAANIAAIAMAGFLYFFVGEDANNSSPQPIEVVVTEPAATQVPAVPLQLGTYDVECRTESGTMTAQLAVLAAAELTA